MRKLVVTHDEFMGWSDTLEMFYPLNIASNLRRYRLGENLPADCVSSFEAFKAHLAEKGLTLNEVEYMPLYAYIHGDISFSLGEYGCYWDSGLAGYIWIEKKEYAEQFGYKRFTKKIRKRFEKDCENLVKSLNSDYYVVELYDDNGEFVDSLGGVLMEYTDEKEVYQFAVDNFGIDDKEIIIEFADYGKTEKYTAA